MDTNSSVAKTLVKQLGNLTLSMMGAKNLVAGTNLLQFAIGRNTKNVNRVQIRLDVGTDTYDVLVFSVRGATVKQLGSASDVHVGELHQTLQTMTGLYTRF